MSSLLAGIQFLKEGTKQSKESSKKEESNASKKSNRKQPNWINPVLDQQLEDKTKSKDKKKEKHEKKKTKKKDKTQKKKHKSDSKSQTKRSKYSDSDDDSQSSGTSNSSDEDKHNVSEPPPQRSTIEREAWMTMPMVSSSRRQKQEQELGQNSEARQKEEEERQKEKKIQEEIEQGIREPSTGMLYGLYDPKDPSNRSDLAPNTIKEQVLVGDGGASWRMKMLERLKAKANSTGQPLEELVRAHFGSLDILQQSLEGSAPANAHLSYKKPFSSSSNHHSRSRSGSRDRKKKTLEIGRDAKDKTLLSKFATRVQHAVSHTMTHSHESKHKSKHGDDWEDEEPIDYSKLPDFEETHGRFSSSHNTQRHGRRRGRKNRSRSRSHSHSRSHSRGRDRDRDQSRERSRNDDRRYSNRRRSRSRSRSPRSFQSRHHETTTKTKRQAFSSGSRDTGLPVQKKQKQEPVFTAKQQEELDKRKAFLYGGQPPPPPPPQKHQDQDQHQDQEQEQKQKKDEQQSLAPRSSKRQEMKLSEDNMDNIDLNKLAAKALRAQMMGKMDLFHRLKNQLNELEAKREAISQATCIPHELAIMGAVPPLVKEDLRYGSRKGKKKQQPPPPKTKRAMVQPRVSPLDEEDTTTLSLEELVRQERTEERQDDMDHVHVRNILRLGNKYKGSELSQSKGASGFDEEEEIDMRMYQNQADHLTKRFAMEKERSRILSQTNQWDKTISSCWLCIQSASHFKKHLIVAMGQYTFLSIVPNHLRMDIECHCMIVPLEHVASMNLSHEQIQEEVSSFKQSLERMVDSSQQKMIYLEQTSCPQKKRHTWIECISVPKEMANDVILYFKQELMQVDEEWSTHKKMIDTSQKTLSKCIPSNFAYFHVEYPQGSFCHVIENEMLFPKDFGRNVIAGMLEKDPPKYNHKQQQDGFEKEKQIVLTFVDRYKKYDWTKK